MKMNLYFAKYDIYTDKGDYARHIDIEFYVAAKNLAKLERKVMEYITNAHNLPHPAEAAIMVNSIETVTALSESVILIN